MYDCDSSVHHLIKPRPHVSVYRVIFVLCCLCVSPPVITSKPLIHAEHEEEASESGQRLPEGRRGRKQDVDWRT